MSSSGDINGEFHWDNSVDFSGERAITYQHELMPGESVYVTYSVGYNEHTFRYRHFETQGEDRHPGSPPVLSGKKPLPSLPWEWKWQVGMGTSLGWAKIDKAKGQSWPEHHEGDDNVVLPKAQALQQPPAANANLTSPSGNDS